MATVLPRCSVALCCANVTFQGGSQLPNYLEVVDELTAPAVPVGIERFFTVFEFKDGVPGVYTTKLKVSGPNGFSTEQRAMDISFTTERINARIVMEIRQFVFPQFGRYKISLLISDKEAGYFTLDVKQGGTLNVVLPPNPPQIPPGA